MGMGWVKMLAGQHQPQCPHPGVLQVPSDTQGCPRCFFIPGKHRSWWDEDGRGGDEDGDGMGMGGDGLG